MHLTDLLSERSILPALDGQTKEHVLQQLVEPLVAQHSCIDGADLLSALYARERLGSTGIAEGVAIPHARLSGLPAVAGVFGRHASGVDFASLDGAPTRLFFLLVAPADSAGQHLKALAQVSRLLQNPALRASLLQAPDRQALYRNLVAFSETATGINQ